MIFPITELLDEQESQVWVEKYFHPQGLCCPGCGATREEAREFRRHKRGFVDYRCSICPRTYNLYTGTLFAGSNLDPRRVVLLVRGVCKGDPATVLAEELALSRQCVHRWRKRLQANGYMRLSPRALPDAETETEERFQNAGEKRGQTLHPLRSAATPRQQATRPRDLCE
jgi:transposase-like protein